MERQLAIAPEKVRGFNYQPSYSSGAFEMWRDFRADVIWQELRRGKELFPGINAVRLWLSSDAWTRSPEKFLAEFETALGFCRELGLKVIPCLFNRWHDPRVDYGGIYLEHFLPGVSGLNGGDTPPWKEYTEQLSAAFGKSPDILVWDLCNEPFAYAGKPPYLDQIRDAEVEWLRKISEVVHGNVEQPVGISTWSEVSDPLIADMVDLYLSHFYYIPQRMKLEDYRERVRRIAARQDKPTLTTETCWGSFDDAKRVEIIRDTLSTLNENRIGFLAHALWTSDTADLNGPEDGRDMPHVGNLSFIRRDGSIRPGHEIFNRF